MKKMLKLAMGLTPLGFIVPIANYLIFGDIMENFIDYFAYVYVPIIAIIGTEFFLFIIYRKCFKR